MKRSFFLFLGLLTINSLSGQNYFPIVDENKEWNVMYVGIGPSDTLYSTYTYKFEGDTIINNLSYLKVFKSEEEIPSSWTFEGGIRETQDKKVYFNKWGNDYLKYDFEREIGDTINVYITEEPAQLIVESIDSIIINDAYRRSITLRYIFGNTYWEQWIEGIGSNRGILESGTANFSGGWRWFLCMSENGELIYMNPNYESCYLITEINEVNKPKLKIFPNPTKNILTIENIKSMEIESISLSNINGQIIKQFGTDKNQIDLSEISSGFYLLKISYKNGEFTDKVIIE